MKVVRIAALVLALVNLTRAQIKQFVGTVTAFKAESAEIEIKPDSAAAVLVKILPDTVAQKIAPGEKSLKNAAAIKPTDVAIGDRVLVALEPGTSDVRRIVVMPAAEITKHDEADRQDWIQRGVSGVVAGKIGNQITLKMRSLQGEQQFVVTVDDKTTYKRYAPDSVKFADAKVSKVDEINIGDQLRARGKKSEDGKQVAAENVVFGTFLTKAGTVASVDAAAKEITLNEMGTGKPLVVKITADSQMKQMPDFSAMMGRAPGGAAPGAGPGGPPPGAMPGGGFRPPGGGGPPDIAQMLERMPPAQLEDVKPGQTLIVSSTKGASDGRLTAITVLANAGMLIQMASRGAGGAGQAAGGARGANAGGMQGGMNGMMGGAGFDLPAMIP